MAIEKINIKNYKSLVDVTIEKPNPFTVFVGPNASGKSNVFEAMDLYSYLARIEFFQLVNSFNGIDSIFNKKSNSLKMEIFFQDNPTSLLIPKRDGIGFQLDNISYPRSFNESIDKKKFHDGFMKGKFYAQFFYNFSRLFIGKTKKVIFPNRDNKKLSLDAGNLEKVLKRILQKPEIREEFLELLSFLIPDFEKLEISSNELSGSDSLLIYERNSKKPFPRHLISDGTFNLIALLTSVFQSDEPQFLCIEEPENGIHPEAIKELVYFFREQCEKNGHYIWLTTHSQSLVSVLKPEELIVVDKINGETRIKQYQNKNLHDFEMDEAWLSNTLDGGLPW